VVTDEATAGGKHSLKFVDDPIAPQTYHPDLESRVPPFGAPEHIGGELSLDLRVGRDTEVAIEVRSTESPIQGPSLHVDSSGTLRANGQHVCSLPQDQWAHLRIAYAFAREGKPSSYEVTLALPGGQEHKVRSASGDAGYRRTDWFVVYGPVPKAGVFFVDNLRLEREKADGAKEVVLQEGFEAGAEAFQEPMALVRRLAERVKKLAPPPVEVIGPPSVRVGLFERPRGEVLVHLHNRDALRADWRRATGPRVILRTAFRVAGARIVVPAEPTFSLADSPHEVRLAPFGLYHIVALQPQPAARE
jgi:hypothetical protein